MKNVALTQGTQRRDETGSIRCINIQQYGTTFLVKLTGPGIGAPRAFFSCRPKISGCPGLRTRRLGLEGILCLGGNWVL